ncbi:Uncharacterized protein FWK35_00013449 [Aphis craccivora]|uniref:Secreted protein n=1 Tax=Aphis craccivora TaxID=307492 RepID=A0A6G0ZHK3_APHCR|nr:Uncharacterized protein FWK35_00013449 [Aphis craccivora]
MRFPLAIISVFILLVLIIDVSYVNAKNVPTTTDGENHLKTTSNHNTDQKTDEKTTSKNDQTNKPCHNKHAPCTRSLLRPL